MSIMTHDPSADNPLELEARADEREAEALLLRAKAKRLRARQDATPGEVTLPAGPLHLTRREYALRANVSEATVTRWLAEGLPSLPVGTTVRIEPVAADEWRRQRGRKPTKTTRRGADEDVDVSTAIAAAGLRAVGGGRR